MADHCGICDTRRPEGGTNHLVLGDTWIEFCRICGETEMLENAAGEELCVADVFDLDNDQPLTNRPDRHTSDQWRHQQKIDNAAAVAKIEADRVAYLATLKGGNDAPADDRALVGLTW